MALYKIYFNYIHRDPYREVRKSSASYSIDANNPINAIRLWNQHAKANYSATIHITEITTIQKQ